MRKRKLETLLLGALAALVAYACTIQLPTSPAPTQIQTVVIGGATGPTGAGSPSPGAGTIHSVKVSQFGEGRCNSGVSPANQSRTVRVGCVAFITCTPKRVDGTDASEVEHGPKPDFFGVTSGGVFVVAMSTENPFNIDVRGTSPGIASLRCGVKGVVSDPAFDLQVVS